MGGTPGIVEHLQTVAVEATWGTSGSLLQVVMTHAGEHAESCLGNCEEMLCGCWCFITSLHIRDLGVPGRCSGLNDSNQVLAAGDMIAYWMIT